MAQFSIAWMPGDGIGNDVMEATRVVLDALKLDAEYIHTDIGWEFWCKEGNALPDRSIETLKRTSCGLFGAITSKPQDEAKEELAPELKDKKLVLDAAALTYVAAAVSAISTLMYYVLLLSGMRRRD